ncbi:MAG: phage protease [Proteobacteria bacterium]|nr:phage protease [Pseudomonadota bacterium]
MHPAHRTANPCQPHVAACAAAVATVAIAPCFFQVAAADAGADVARIWVQLTPAGDFSPRDGRELPVAHWHIDARTAAATIAAFRAGKTPPVIDYEHQTLLAESNGQPAPAAGRLVDMQWREGHGLFGQIELTARARQYIADGEYSYFSPVFTFDAATGDVLAIVMGALTNHPALDGMQPLVLRAAATARFAHREESHAMKPLLLAVCAALSLDPETTTEEAAIAALRAHAAADPLAALRAELGVAATADAAVCVAACAALKAAGAPDPAKFIGIEAFNTVKDQLAALTARIDGDKVDEIVKAALADGRLLAPQESWARELGKKDFASLKAYVDSAQPIAALRKTQTDGKPPVDGDDTGLSADELAICKRMSLDPKDFAASKNERAA